MPSEQTSVPDSAARQAANLLAIRDDVMRLYERTRAALRDPVLRGGDMIMLKHPVKAPFFDLFDSLSAMAREIAAGEWEHDEPRA